MLKMIQRSSELILSPQARGQNWFLLLSLGQDASTHCPPRRHMSRTLSESNRDRAVGVMLAPQWSQEVGHRVREGYSQDSRASENHLSRFGTCLVLFPPPFILIFPFLNGILCLAHHSILEAVNLPSFPGSQLEGNFASG